MLYIKYVNKKIIKLGACELPPKHGNSVRGRDRRKTVR